MKMTRFDKLRQPFRVVVGLLAFCAIAALLTSPPQRAEAHETGVCDGKNWCERRNQTCGPTNGYGKCLITRFGKNFCGELLFQAQTCADCAEPTCVNCICIGAWGGPDKCNNGVNGYPYICVRNVANQ